MRPGALFERNRCMDRFMTIGERDFFRQGKTYIMGILNMTPDSFSDGGSFTDTASALRRVAQMLDEGADIIDVGGESTRPGYTQISDAEEIARVLPVIKAIKARFNVPVSVDTYKSTVAKAALAAGADLINDIWGLKYDPEMAGVIARSGAACCLMYNRQVPHTHDFLAGCLKELKESVALALAAGIHPDKIILDPGVGFGKTYEQNLLVIKHLDAFRALGYPLLLGTSRKSVIGLTLHVPASERVIGTAVTSAAAVHHGCAFVRVHDIRENYEAIKMAEAIKYVPESTDTEPASGSGPEPGNGGQQPACDSEPGPGNGGQRSGGSGPAAAPPPIWHRVYLGIGANLGDRRSYIQKAVAAITAVPDVRRVICSDLLETAPYGGVAQDDFLNGCISMETTKSPRELLAFLNGIEADLGRERIIRWGPRTIDLDILLYDDWVVDEDDLKIPHIDMQNREFVLKPLAGIAGHVQHPVLHRTIHELYSDLFAREQAKGDL